MSGVGFQVSAARSPTPDTYTPRHLAEKILASRDVLAGERKQVTVLFADVVGSTELIRGRDAEEAQRLLDGVVTILMEAVHRYEGTVSRLMGDGLMAMFGAPVAHEDHAVRACYAALAMLEAARRHAEGLRRSVGFTIAIRVGLSAGEVVVRTISDDLHMDYTAMGETVHLAARMEQLADPGTAVLTAETLALVEGYVQVRSLGPVPVKGVGEAVEVFQLVGAGLARTRLQAAASRGLTRFVGRQAELEAMYRALGQAEAGRGQVIALVGEPGVGKSRLVWELTHSHRTEGWTILESGSVSYGKATSYLPVIDLLKAYCRIESRDDERTIREKVAGKLLMLDRALEPTLPALLALLDAGERPSPPAPLPAAGEGSRSSVSPSPALRDIGAADVRAAQRRGLGSEGAVTAWELLDPAQRRRQTLDALKRILLRESQEQPLLLVFEDLHWIDSETQALLDSLVDSVPTARILLLVNFRPEYRHDWGNRGAYTQIRVDPLGAESAGDLLDGLLGADPSLAPLKALLTTRTDGNPFFLEESVRSLVESGQLIGERGAYRLAGPLASVRVPATVQAVLSARIDRLPPDAKDLLQTASAIGKDVPDVLLRAVADRAEDDLHRRLAALQAAEFLYEVSIFPELEYTFKHALTHEVAYGSLLQERRKALHARVVEAIERLHADRLAEHVERLAHHALRAERWPEAIEYARSAGHKALGRSAYREALSWFEQALDGLRGLP
ncbi:MAG TPA: adenylate/guanylate cyclase domain-containing protein, partial [Chloroflexota bacterium]|nr:adenylate/guanylate cyclase domain-containing protein [Chloroflexota bacterium]